MTDISKCNGETKAHKVCPLQRECYRFTAQSAGKCQSWIEAMYDFKKKKCDYFWKGKGGKKK